MNAVLVAHGTRKRTGVAMVTARSCSAAGPAVTSAGTAAGRVGAVIAGRAPSSAAICAAAALAAAWS